jgi:Leucine-rich repeat (LRR) protein
MSALKILWLSNTSISDATLQQLGDLKSLEFLDVTGTQVTRTGREVLRKKLPNLTVEPSE